MINSSVVIRERVDKAPYRKNVFFCERSFLLSAMAPAHGTRAGLGEFPMPSPGEPEEASRYIASDGADAGFLTSTAAGLLRACGK